MQGPAAVAQQLLVHLHRQEVEVGRLAARPWRASRPRAPAPANMAAHGKEDRTTDPEEPEICGHTPPDPYPE